MFLKKSLSSKDENAIILLDIIKRVVGRYNTVVVVNDNVENLSTVVSFFSKIGFTNINYIFEPKEEELCTLVHGNNINGASCSIQRNITVKTSDLSFYPCFKAAKNSYLKYGSIDFSSLEVIPENVELAALMYYYNPVYSNPRCDRCKYAIICHKGCYVSNYEKNLDITQPIVENCEIYKKEIDKMIDEQPDLNRLLIERRNTTECTR